MYPMRQPKVFFGTFFSNLCPGLKQYRHKKNVFVFDEKFSFSVSKNLRISCSLRTFIFYVHSSIMIQVFFGKSLHNLVVRHLSSNLIYFSLFGCKN